MDYKYLSANDITKYPNLAMCEACGALVFNTVAHDRHHAELEEARRQARSAYGLTRPIGG